MTMNKINASNESHSFEDSSNGVTRKTFAGKNESDELGKRIDLDASDSIKRRRLYSRRGDLGETSLCFGPRVGKDQLRIVACGTLDELNSFLGLARAEGLVSTIDRIVYEIQKKLFDVSAELMTLNPSRHDISTLQNSEVQTLESLIDIWDNQLPPLTQFILPGGCKSAATLHVARAVCRRAERQVVALLRKDETVSRIIIAWLNRLSDLIFVLARSENSLKQANEVKIIGK